MIQAVKAQRRTNSWAVPVLVVCAILAAQLAGYYYWVKEGVAVQKITLLNTLPREMGTWGTVDEQYIPDSTLSVLRPDDYVMRSLVNRLDRSYGDLFIAYFSSHQTGEGPHTPEACLPGAGWKPISKRTVQIPVGSASIPVTRFLVEKDGERMLVLFWYQNQFRAVAEENTARLYLISDTLMNRGKDAALVRVAAPVTKGEEHAEQVAGSLAAAVYPNAVRFFQAP